MIRDSEVIPSQIDHDGERVAHPSSKTFTTTLRRAHSFRLQPASP